MKHRELEKGYLVILPAASTARDDFVLQPLSHPLAYFFEDKVWGLKPEAFNLCKQKTFIGKISGHSGKAGLESRSLALALTRPGDGGSVTSLLGASVSPCAVGPH